MTFSRLIIFHYKRFSSFLRFKQTTAPYLNTIACAKTDYIEISALFYNFHFRINRLLSTIYARGARFKFHVTIASYTEVRKGKVNRPVSFSVRHHPNVAIGILSQTFVLPVNMICLFHSIKILNLPIS